MESEITKKEFAGLLAYITNNPNKIPDLKKSLRYGTDNVKVKYLRKLLANMFHIIYSNFVVFVLCHFLSSVIFTNNTEYLLNLVLFFSASYRQFCPKTHSYYRRATQC